MNFDQSDEILLFSFCVCFTFISSAAPYPKPISSYLNYTNVHWRKYLVNVEWPKPKQTWPKQSNLTAIICIKILLNFAKCSGVSSFMVCISMYHRLCLIPLTFEVAFFTLFRLALFL